MAESHHPHQGHDDEAVAHAAVCEASQWASLVDVSELLAPHSSELCNSAWTEYRSRSQLTVDMLLKDLAIWLGKQAGVTFTCMAKVEEYAARALAKMAHSITS